MRRSPLADVQIRRDLVEEVEVRVACQRGDERDPLEFPAGEVVDVVVDDRLDARLLDEVVEGTAFVGLVQQFDGLAVERFGIRSTYWGLRATSTSPPRICSRYSCRAVPRYSSRCRPSSVPRRSGPTGCISSRGCGRRWSSRCRSGRESPSPALRRGSGARTVRRRSPRSGGPVRRSVPVGVDDFDRVERTLVRRYHWTRRRLISRRCGPGRAGPRGSASSPSSRDDALFARPVRRTEVRALVATTVRGTPVQVDDGDTIVGHR